MQTMNISLPDPLKDFVDHRIAEGHYSSVSEYIRELIRDDENFTDLSRDPAWARRYPCTRQSRAGCANGGWADLKSF
jgi:Arc/MetJ-type ribon-helix-helix transcriptional regulator